MPTLDDIINALSKRGWIKKIVGVFLCAVMIFVLSLFRAAGAPIIDFIGYLVFICIMIIILIIPAEHIK